MQHAPSYFRVATPSPSKTHWQAGFGSRVTRERSPFQSRTNIVEGFLGRRVPSALAGPAGLTRIVGLRGHPDPRAEASLYACGAGVSRRGFSMTLPANRGHAAIAPASPAAPFTANGVEVSTVRNPQATQ